MGFLVFSVVAALAASTHVFNGTGSLFLSFVVYAATGTLVLLLAILTETLADDKELD